MTTKLAWGILGTGAIATKFADQLPQARWGDLVAAGSRTAERAAAFAGKYPGARPHATYEALLNDPEVTAIYNSLPNGLHHHWTIAALRAGKHVLCEKPLAANLAEAEEMFAAAEEAGRVLVEAFMYRCHPLIDRLLEEVRGGAIGQLRLIRTHFSFNRQASPGDGRYQPDQAGGSLMDVGCYCINLARAVTGSEPDQMHVIAHRHSLGVDDYASGLLRLGDVLCCFTCGMTVEDDRTTYLGGTTGYLEIPSPWFTEGRMTLVQGEQQREIHVPSHQPAYALEADRFAECVAGAPPWITKEDSLGNQRVLDALRQSL